MLTLSLVAVDVVALTSALAIAYLIRFKIELPLLPTPAHTIAFYSSVAFWAVPVWIGLFAAFGLYGTRSLFTGSLEYLRVFNACTVGIVAVIVISYLDATLAISRGWLLMTWLLSGATVSGFRFLYRRLVRQLRGRGMFLIPTVIVGANDEGKTLAEQLLADPSCGRRVLGFIDNRGRPGTSVVAGLPLLGGLTAARDVVRTTRASEIVVATTALAHVDLLSLCWTFVHDRSVDLRLSSGVFEILTTGAQVQEISGVPFITPRRVRITGLDAFLKTSLDYVLAACALVVLSPVLLVIGLLIRLDSPGPVLHRRRVLGVSGKQFDAFKFRTMIANADEVLMSNISLRQSFEAAFKLSMDPRITRIGHVLRKTSLDELPQLLNVLRGEMSLVGPRMIVPEEAARYGKWQLNLVTVKPGITGPWQVNGRSDLPYEQRIQLSMLYIRNYTIWQDLAILFRTVGVVLHGKGAF